MSKAFTGREKFSGKWEENVEASLVLYETLSTICKLSERERETSIGLPIMLNVVFFTFYTVLISYHATYNAKIMKMKEWLSSDLERKIMLRSFHESRLAEDMKNNPDKSEVSVFRSFSLKLSTLQKQPDTHYHHNDVLVDQLIYLYTHQKYSIQ